MKIISAAFSAAMCWATLSSAQVTSQDFTDEYYRQWGLDAISAVPAWRYIESKGLKPGGAGATIGILDDGVEADHPEFKGRVKRSNKLVGNHGNYVASIAAGGQNGKGIIGVAPFSTIYAASPNEAADLAEMTKAVAADKAKIDVFVMSYGLTCDKEVSRLEKMTKQLLKDHPDAVFVASGGQDGAGGGHGYPAGWAGEPWVDGRMIVAGAYAFDRKKKLYVRDSYKCDLRAVSERSDTSINDRNLTEYCVFAPGGEDVLGVFGATYKQKYSKYFDASGNLLPKYDTATSAQTFCVPQKDANGQAIKDANGKVLTEVNPALANEVDPLYTAYTEPASGGDPEFYLTDGGGTSAAAPFVAGVVAVVRSLNPDLSAKAAAELVRGTSRIFYEFGDEKQQPSNTYGWGLVDINRAVRKAIELRKNP